MPLRFLLPILMMLAVVACESTPEEPEVDCNTLASKQAVSECKQQQKEHLTRQLITGARGSRP
jgi:hypothetical protein